MESSFEFQTVHDSGGVRIHCLPTQKFKGVGVRYYFHNRLEPDATELSLIQSLAKRGCEGFPDLRSITIHLEELYGSSVGLNLSKIGERNLFVGRLSFAAERFLPPRGAGLTDRLLDFFDALMTKPVGEAGEYRSESFEQERLNLRRQLEGLKDDKDGWAHERFLQTMYPDEPYGIHEYGELERLSSLTNPQVRTRLDRLLTHAPLDIYAVGDFDVKAITARLLAGSCVQGPKDDEPGPPVAHPVRPEQIVIEESEVEQARLLIGCPVDLTDCTEKDYVALHLYNTLLGGGMFSKLFRSVREEASLAYSVHSSLESHKGLMMISTGIDAEAFEPALALIRKQLEDMAAGRIGADEFSAARETVVGRLRSVPDSPGAWSHQHLERMLAGYSFALGELPSRFAALEPADLVAVAPRIRCETIYLLRSPSA